MVNMEVKVTMSFPLSSLPDDLVLSCLARVTRSDHAALSLVSKKYHTLMASPELYNIRSQLGYTSFYVCLTMNLASTSLTPRWFMLSRENITNRVMSPVPSLPSQPLAGSAVVSLDWGIYVIGGLIDDKKRTSSDVWLLDCRTHTWSQVPSMKVARAFAGAGVVGGKIYVFGSCWKDMDIIPGEVFDPKTQTWEILASIPDSRFIFESVVIEEKVYVLNEYMKEIFYYSPSENKWGTMDRDVMNRDICTYCYVTAEKLLCGCDLHGNVYWSELEKFAWKEVKGLEALRHIFPMPTSFTPSERLESNFSRLRIFGANVMVIWFKYDLSNKKVDIWCAEISFERQEEKGEVWGNIEWSDVVVTLDHDPLPCRKLAVRNTASVNV